MAESIVIIGAGIAGLSTGCYGRMNGYDTHVFEMHNAPGGLCTSWNRNGYVFDGCVHWLLGTKAGTSFNRVWMELGALQGRKVVDHEEFLRVEGPEGKALVLYSDAGRFEEHLKSLSPKDARVIEELTKNIRRFGKLDPPIDKPGGLEGFSMLFKMAPMMMGFKKWAKTSLQDYSRNFTDPFLRSIFPLTFDVLKFPVLGMISTLGWMNERNAGYPIGGSLEMAKAIEKRYLDLGGEISYRSRVEKILVEDGKATGVRLADGTEHKADIVVSAADGHATIFDMLDGAFINDTIRGYYRNMPLFPPIIQVSLGVKRDLSPEPHSVSFPLEYPVRIAGRSISRMSYKHFCYDPTMAPAGKSVITTIIETDYEYWKALHDDEEMYREEKERVGSIFTAEMEKRFPGIREDIETVDVATPVTYVRYTGNWKGSFEGWLLTTENSTLMIKGMPNTLPGLENFYMAGQWIKPGGGLPPSALSGRETVQAICKKYGSKFQADMP
ncbi:MAG: NAD(P)/FAD-dependent oxidoreductase [Actinobacteria bacterium]|nr:NAD(P)/FAD-dependent oxidoreductase [Actinomycetota bacterium]